MAYIVGSKKDKRQTDGKQKDRNQMEKLKTTVSMNQYGKFVVKVLEIGYVRNPKLDSFHESMKEATEASEKLLAGIVSAPIIPDVIDPLAPRLGKK